METNDTEKIYVAIGNDMLDGLQTLGWVLKKWKSHPISIVILHVKHKISKGSVYTLLGKLPAEFACEEQLELSRKYKQETINNLLSKYIAFCENVPAEILEVEKFDEPRQKLTIDLILGLGITKLVMAISFMKPSCLKSRDFNAGVLYVHQHKPEFCELFIICGGKEVAIMRGKTTCIDWLERKFDRTIDSQHRSSCGSSINLEPHLNTDEWEFYLQEIENYLHELLSMNLEEEICEEGSEVFGISPIETYVKECNNSDNMNAAEKTEILKSKLNEAYKIIQMKRKEEKANMERYAKAEWAIYFCNRREEELESLKKEEVARREEITTELTVENEQLNQIRREVEESQKRLSSLTELLKSLQISTLTVSEAKTQLEEAVAETKEVLIEIEKVKKQRDVLNRSIEFFKEKNSSTGTSVRLIEKGCGGLREYTKEEIMLATQNFSEQLRMKSGRDWSNVYKGHIDNFTVAIKMLSSVPGLSQQHFLSKVRSLGSIRHPHLIAMLGFCSEPKCLVLEYMHNGSLEEMLFCRSSPVLTWHDCIRIAIEVCSGLGFLDAAQPGPTIHCHPSPSKVLLDSNLVAKITGFGLHECCEECNDGLDMKAIGVLMMHLLTGRNDLLTIDGEDFLDEIGERWPLDIARELVELATRCMSMNCEANKAKVSITNVMEELHEIRRKGVVMATREGWRVIFGRDLEGQNSSDVPSIFLCPILQKVMKNPHVAADGFSYEHEAIEEWLQLGHDISPKNLRLKHRSLTPNHALRSLIENWQSKRPKVSN